jgi:site-specific recombinase XerD
MRSVASSRYLHGVTHFSRYFRRSPDQLGPEDIRKYQAMLFTKLKYSPNTVTLRLASLRFFYIHVLKRGWSIVLLGRDRRRVERRFGNRILL